MADAVKKSRIVSDEEQDLEEAMLEEFNLRLKSCMSNDNLQLEDSEPPDQQYENIIASPVKTVKPIKIPSPAREDIPQVTSPVNGMSRKASDNFIQAEIDAAYEENVNFEENVYDEPKTVIKNGVHNHNGHGFIENLDLVDFSKENREVLHDHDEEAIYEHIPEKTDSEDQNYVEMNNKKDGETEDAPSSININFSSPESPEYQNSPENEESPNFYESIEPKKEKPSFTLPTTSLTDFSEEKSFDSDTKTSIKDKMFLCSDTSTLLFTQTVTSPMLTPSEENIDFLKGFQRENTNSDSTNSPPKEQDSPEVSETAEEGENSENFYENTEFYKNTTPENVYENLRIKEESLEEIQEEENIYDNLSFENGTKIETIPETFENQEVINENIYQNIEEALSQQKSEVVKLSETDRTSIATDASLEEFIRYEKEVAESPLFKEDEIKAFDDDLVKETDEDKDNDCHLVKNDPANKKSDEKCYIQAVEDIEEPKCYKIPKDILDLEKDVLEMTKIVDSSTRQDKITSESYKELIYHTKAETGSNYYEKYTESLTKTTKNEIVNREKDTETVPAQIVKNLKSQFVQKLSAGGDTVTLIKKDTSTKSEVKKLDLVGHIKKFESKDGEESNTAKESDSTEYSETIEETNNPGEMKIVKKKKVKKTKKEEKENISVKSSFSKFDALQKKNLLHVRSSDSTKAQEKFNGAQIDPSTCKSCGKQVFQMEQIKAERAIWHKNCFRCTECNKQLTVDIYQSNEGLLYCKPHFKALFAPRVVEDDAPQKPRKHELIICENHPVELPDDVVRASDKPDLGLEELQSLNVKQRFQVFEHHQSTTETSETERGGTPVNVKRSPSILSKLARFQKHGMDIGVSNEQLDGIPIEESSSEEEEVEEEIPDGEDPDLVRAKRVQKEKPFHFTNMSDVKNKWEHGDQGREERREERKQEIQTIRNRLFMGKQEKMKEAYQQAVMQSESSTNLRRNMSEEYEVCDTKSIKERFEKGEVAKERQEKDRVGEEEEVYESEMSKKSRSLFLELDATASKAPQMSPITPPKVEVKKAREAYLNRQSTEDTVKSSTEVVEEIEVKTADIQEKFKFFETYKEPEKQRKQFRITPPRDPSQVKTETPDREVYRDPEVIRSEEIVDDSVIAKETHTASKMLNKFRQMEENLQREPEPQGPKPLKCFTPPPEPARTDENTESEYEEEEEEEEEEIVEEVDHHGRLPDDVMDAQKAARAKQLRAKFEKWEAQEIKREQQNSINIHEEYTEEQTNIESTRVLRAKFESMRNQSSTETKSPRTKPNRFVDVQNSADSCQGCNGKVYPLEKISLHGNIYHKSCFRCMECSCVLRMDSYSYNKGLLYCMPHFKRLFISKGDYDSGFGLEQSKEKWNNKAVNMTVA